MEILLSEISFQNWSKNLELTVVIYKVLDDEGPQ